MLKAVSDRIIVRLEKNEKDGFVIEPEKKYTNRGTVESVGDKVSGVKLGDKIVFHCFDELPLDEDLAVIRQKSLLGIYE